MRCVVNQLHWIGGLLFLSATQVYAAEPVKITVSPWCPYICDDQTAPGALVEITTAALRKGGFSSTFTKLPWLRQMASTQSGAMDAVLGIVKTDAPDLIFPTRSTGRYQPCFYVLATSNWEYNGIASLKSVRLSVLKGQTFNNKEMDSYIRNGGTGKGTIDFLSTENYLPQHFQKLILGRVDVMLDDAKVASHYLEQTHQTSHFKQVSCLETTPIWIGFSPLGKHSQDYAAAFDEGLEAIQKSGQLKAIIKKYGMDEASF
ncbi:substrate-binding periplasmic protein [Chitinimonas sp. PSY-7]|uniref:transporter substrate-binding domain-containing protein n=1 Tax=Chitinimonas sp. PSY-7 TaxID=3459088 RepID=UPI0040403762